MSETYGKYGTTNEKSQSIMEYNEFFPFINKYLPEELKTNHKFMDYLSQDEILEEFCALIMMVLPGDRTSFYEYSEVASMRKAVYGETGDITESFGFYPLLGRTPLIRLLALFNSSILFISLIMDIVIILFAVISILLIYSLLMITTETKTFDIGIMRLIGLSSCGFVMMIFTQAVMFVFPSIIFAYACSYPALWYIFSQLLGSSLSSGEVSFVPGAVATVEALAVGLLIPALSAIIPI